jgi:hypothetical protein
MLIVDTVDSAITFPLVVVVAFGLRSEWRSHKMTASFPDVEWSFQRHGAASSVGWRHS